MRRRLLPLLFWATILAAIGLIWIPGQLYGTIGWLLAIIWAASAYRWQAFALELHKRAVFALDVWQRHADQLEQLVRAGQRGRSSSNATRDR